MTYEKVLTAHEKLMMTHEKVVIPCSANTYIRARDPSI